MSSEKPESRKVDARKILPLDAGMAELVFERFARDVLVSRKELKWVDRKLRKYCGLDAALSAESSKEQK